MGGGVEAVFVDVICVFLEEGSVGRGEGRRVGEVLPGVDEGDDGAGGEDGHLLGVAVVVARGVGIVWKVRNISNNCEFGCDVLGFDDVL